MAYLAHSNNGVARFVYQLKRVTFHYCAKGGSSNGIREYINSSLGDFATKNPHTTVYVRHRAYKHPRIVAEFLNGTSRIVSVKNFSPEEIGDQVKLLRSSSGVVQRKKLNKSWHTNRPSIQGTWTPFLFK